MLLALTGGKREPWCLVVEDLARPAFMQPPVPEGKLDGFKHARFYADEVDVLVTSKNHDVKMARVGRPRAEHWVYALVTLQTMEGYSGPRNYGVARMNSGAGSRPGVALTPTLDYGTRFRRDVSIAIAARDEIARGRYKSGGGVALVWLEPWNGETSLSVDALDPLFIEACRRLRLVVEDGRIAARFCPTTRTRIAADELKGNTGDLWTPIDRKESKALTLGDGGFDYRKTQDILLAQDYEPGAAQVAQRGDAGLLFIASVLARGMGKTNGYHDRLVAIPQHVTGLLRRQKDRDLLAARSRERVERVAEALGAVLKPALLTLIQGAPQRLDFQDRRAQRWLDAMNDAVDALFFERLWADATVADEQARKSWANLVLALARGQLERAYDSAPIPSARRYRAISAAGRVFEGAARKRFSEAFEEGTS